MARSKARKHGLKKLQPTELDIYVNIPEGAGAQYLDIAQCLSQLNRKFYRQGMQYVVQEMELLSSNVSGVLVFRLPHYWPSVNAWTKTQALWLQQQNDRLEESGLEQTTARYRDFKIFMNADHATNGFGANAQSRDVITEAAAQLVSPTVDSDWEASQVVLPNKAAPGNTVEYFCHMMGADNTPTSFGMIKAYADSRNRPMQTDPNIVDVASGGIFGEMFDVDEATGDIVTNAQEENNLLPYLNDIDSAFEFYPGGSNSPTTGFQECLLSVSATGDRVLGSRTGSFFANCGLLYLLSTSSGTSDVLRITLAPGDYKGVMARPMQDVN